MIHFQESPKSPTSLVHHTAAFVVPAGSSSNSSSNHNLNPASLPFVPGSGAAAAAAAAQAAAHQAAQAVSASTAARMADNAEEEFDELKSPISLIHESALKRNLKVVFQVN